MVWYRDIIWVGQYLMITSNKVVIKAKSFLKSIQKDGRKDESVDEAGITKKVFSSCQNLRCSSNGQ